MKVNIEHASKTGSKKDKIDIKIDSHDMWSMDVTIAYIVYPLIKKFRDFHKKEGVGFPSTFLPEGYDEIEDVEEYKPIEDKARAEWLECLNKMVYAFYWIIAHKNPPHEIRYHKQQDLEDKPYKKQLRGLDYMDKLRLRQKNGWASQETINEYIVAEFEHRKKIQEGLDLFARHFRSLWI